MKIWIFIQFSIQIFIFWLFICVKIFTQWMNEWVYKVDIELKVYIWGTLLDRRLFQCNYQGFIFQGHGKSEGPRAYAVSMEHVICQFDFLSLPLVQIICERYLCFLPNDWQVEQDILRHCGFLKSRYPGVPIFIYGDFYIFDIFLFQINSTLSYPMKKTSSGATSAIV